MTTSQNVKSWDKNIQYSPGQSVSYEGKVYIARYPTKDECPTKAYTYQWQKPWCIRKFIPLRK